MDKNQKQRQDFVDEIREQYAELREEFYAGLEDRKWVHGVFSSARAHTC